MKTNEPVYQGPELEQRMTDLDGWQVEDGLLKREYRTDGWRTTMMVVNAIAFLAEAANHHPDLEVHWPSVVVRLQTHSAGGITDKDLELARRIEQLVTWQPSGGFPGLAGQTNGWLKR